VVADAIPPKIWFTSETTLPSFENDFSLSPTRPVTPNPSRKEFFSRLLGVTAVFSLFPKLFAKTALDAAGGPETNGSATPSLPFVVRSDLRAVARRVDTV